MKFETGLVPVAAPSASLPDEIAPTVMETLMKHQTRLEQVLSFLRSISDPLRFEALCARAGISHPDFLYDGLHGAGAWRRALRAPVREERV